MPYGCCTMIIITKYDLKTYCGKVRQKRIVFKLQQRMPFTWLAQEWFHSIWTYVLDASLYQLYAIYVRTVKKNSQKGKVKTWNHFHTNQNPLTFHSTHHLNAKFMKVKR